MIQIENGRAYFVMVDFENNTFVTSLISSINNNTFWMMDCNFSAPNIQYSLNDHFLLSITDSTLEIESGVLFNGSCQTKCIWTQNSQISVNKSNFTQCLGSIEAAQNSHVFLWQTQFIANFEIKIIKNIQKTELNNEPYISLL